MLNMGKCNDRECPDPEWKEGKICGPQADLVRDPWLKNTWIKIYTDFEQIRITFWNKLIRISDIVLK